MNRTGITSARSAGANLRSNVNQKNKKLTIMTNKSNKALKLLAAGTSLLMTGNVFADKLEETMTEILTEGKVSLNVRARYEYNDDSRPGVNDVDGYSVRTRLGYTSGAYAGFKASIEMEDISFLDDDDRPVLDPTTTELNQLWLSYSNEDFGSAKLGRQIYTLDDHRFIGHVGWRQNIQTFDAITGDITAIPNTSIKLGFLDSVNRINATSADLNGYLVNISFKPIDSLTLTAFGYGVDFHASALDSSDTLGFRAVGSLPIEDFVFKYAGSIAFQEDNGGSPTGVSYDNNYYAFDGSVGYKGFTLGGGFEILEGDGVTGFSTPLATVHKFNGWADVFAGRSLGLGGGAGNGLFNGLEDYYIKAGYKIPVGNGIPVSVIYHWFETENAGLDLGTEIDFVAKYKINKYLTAVAKYAYYEDDDVVAGYFDANKTVTTIELNFKY